MTPRFSAGARRCLTSGLLLVCGLWSGSLVVYGQANEKAGAADSKVVRFESIVLPEPVSCVAITEDGKQVVITHQGANLVTVWDVLGGKIIKSFAAGSPRSVLCRGDFVFIANNGHGTINKYSRKQNYELIDQFEVEKPNLVHLSAPQGKHFQGIILASFFGGGPRQEEGGSGFFTVDTNTSKSKLYPHGCVASFNYDGTTISTQGSPGTGGCGGVRNHRASAFLAGKSEQLFHAPFDRGPWLSQVHPGGYWYGASLVGAGGPEMHQIPLETAQLIIPDFSQRVLYSLNPDQIRAHRIDSALTEIDHRKLAWPEIKPSPRDGIFRAQKRHDVALLDLPIGYTHGKELYLFVVNEINNTLCTAKTAAFATPPPQGVEFLAVADAGSGGKPGTAAPVDEFENDPQQVTLTELILPEVVNSMALTEDGKYLIATHQASNLISVWDVQARKVVKTLETSAPRLAVCRGEGVYVVNDMLGTVSFFSRTKDWELMNQFDVGHTNIVHISAPQAENFKGEFIVTCHGPGPEGSYRGCKTFHLDTKTDRAREIGGHAIATCSYDGKVVVGQGSFNLSPSGGIAGFQYDDFLKGKPQAVFHGGEQQTLYVYQVHPGSFWYGGKSVFAGAPNMQKMQPEMGHVVVPDQSQRILYALSYDRIVAHRLDSALTEVGSRKLNWPPGKGLISDGVFSTQDRNRGYHLDHPCGFTHDRTLHLFLFNPTKNCIYVARTPAMSIPTSAGVHLATGGAATPSPGTSAKPEAMPAATESPFGLPDRLVEGTKVDVKLKGADGAEYQLLTGPQGLAVSKAGQLTWTPTHEQMGVHQLKIRVKAGTQVSFIRPSLEVIDKEFASHSNGSLDKLDQGERLPLDIDHFDFAPGADYRSMLVLQGDKLRVLEADGIKVKSELQLARRYRQILPRGREFVALSKEPNELDLLDGETGKVRKTIKIEKTGVRIMEVVDMACHPQRPLTYLAIKHDIQIPRFRLLIVDEETGSIEAPEDAIGTWIKIDPQGQRLYAGFEDLYRTGTRFHINPGWQLIDIPEYGNIDWLMSYEIRGKDLRIKEVHTKAGGNGSGIVLSPDGQRITYLSHVGTPEFSGNLVAWKTNKFKDEPVSYKIKGKANPQLLAFHPSLPLVAIPTETGAIMFHRETGAELTDKLQLTAKGLGDAKIEQALFAPDGKSLIFVCNDLASGRYLRKVGLRLEKNELALVEKGLPEFSSLPVEDLSVVKNQIKVKRTEVDALKTPSRKEMLTTKEIARRYSPAVVVIQSEEGFGSGFVVGRRGLILTCAHVLPGEGKVTVTFDGPTSGKPKPVTATAQIVRRDDDRDLALLKIDSAKSLVPVYFGEDGEAPELGEEVTVIGNPGLGGEILTRTITTGVISSTLREIDKAEFIQTSAAVNAGNSGGPVFSPQGRVIGLVVLKANIEATAFAVPLKDLRQFVLDATETP